MSRCLLLRCGLLWSVLAPLMFAQFPGESYRFPAVEPDAAVATFTVQEGFRLQLVAHEPLVADPVDGCFDADGHLFVAEMHGYPYSEEVRAQQPEPLGKSNAGVIRRLSDLDRDGIYETSTVFARGISWPTSVACWQNGVFVLAPDKLYYFRDADRDGVAEDQEVVLEGFSRANVQGLANNMKWGLDGKLYISGGTNGGEIMQSGELRGSLLRRDLALNPRTRQVEFTTGGQQFGQSFDDWGNRFVCSNSNHIQQVLFSAAALDRGTISTVSGPIISIAAEGPAAPVVRKSPAEPWRIERTARRAADPEFRNRLPMTELVPTGFFTSATGVTIYRGHAYPAAFQGNAFIGDVGGNLVHRKSMERQGTRWIARRADEEAEFIASTDTWFRPVNFINGPDGCLYILDMYRETIEHPASIPEDIKARVDLESGSDRGRIYRLVPPSGRGAPWVSLSERTSSELVQFLEHPNGWQRETAGRLLLERQDRTVAAELRRLARESALATGRIHALHVLRNLALVEEADLVAALTDSDPNVVTHAVGLCQPFLASPESTLRKSLLKVAGHTDPQVRFQLALVLTGVPAKYRGDLWDALARVDDDHEDVRAALLLAVPRDAVALTLQVCESSRVHPQSLLRPLLEYTGRTANENGLGSVLRLIFDDDEPQRQSHQLAAVAVGLKARQASLANVLAADAELARKWDEVCRHAAGLALNAENSDLERAAAIDLLAFAPAAMAAPVYRQLLNSAPEEALLRVTIDSASRQTEATILDLLADQLAESTPRVRELLITALLGMRGGPERLLTLVAEERLASNDLLPNQREQLRIHPDAGIRQRFAELPQFAVNADRQVVVKRFAEAATLTGDVVRGRALFAKHCAACHRLGEVGHNVAPDFKSIKNKSREDLLLAILDPNREAQPNYLGYTLLLADGRSMIGLVVSENAQGITLRQAEGKDFLVNRAEIEALKSTGLSLMPVGLENVLAVQDVADIIAVIKE